MQCLGARPATRKLPAHAPPRATPCHTHTPVSAGDTGNRPAGWPQAGPQPASLAQPLWIKVPTEGGSVLSVNHGQRTLCAADTLRLVRSRVRERDSILTGNRSRQSLAKAFLGFWRQASLGGRRVCPCKPGIRSDAPIGLPGPGAPLGRSAHPTKALALGLTCRAPVRRVGLPRAWSAPTFLTPLGGARRGWPQPGRPQGPGRPLSAPRRHPSRFLEGGEPGWFEGHSAIPSRPGGGRALGAGAGSLQGLTPSWGV